MHCGESTPLKIAISNSPCTHYQNRLRPTRNRFAVTSQTFGVALSLFTNSRLPPPPTLDVRGVCGDQQLVSPRHDGLQRSRWMPPEVCRLGVVSLSRSCITHGAGATFPEFVHDCSRSFTNHPTVQLQSSPLIIRDVVWNPIHWHSRLAATSPDSIIARRIRHAVQSWVQPSNSLPARVATTIGGPLSEWRKRT